ncbi:MAG: isoleucine--tRNA ligase [Myxococcota bacterium]
MFQRVPQKIDFPKSEREILAFWREAKIFEQSLALREGRETFVFYEGPPTANGTPHNGHVLTRVIKDLFPRYKTMRGYKVPRKAGWDTHGLPVEVEVEKELGIHGKAEIEAFGVEEFTHRCIASVFRYTDVWRELTERIGFWVDLDDAYVTFHKSYVESVWWALSELFKKGLLYQGHKVVWWWPQGGTALSSGEVGLGYKTVDDPSVTVRFRVDGAENTSFLGWTTTPWTLPSNCALAVRTSLDYVYAVHEGETFILAEARADAVLGEGTYEIVRRLKGSELVGMTYRPVFDYAQPEDGTPFRVIPADFVTADSGTGVVHIAPAFGEDDFKVGKEAGVGILQLVLPDGTFDPRVTDFAGRFCKEADRDIIRNLRGRDLLFKEEVYRHDYPFCWRADDDPLIQYARPAWFIRTTDVAERARAHNQEIQWIPGHIKDGRFGDFLANNVDWALSRERYWGTPLNIWICEGCEAHEAPASAAVIEARNPQAFAAFQEARAANPELSEHLMVHKPWVDEVTFACEACGATMRRVPEVIDCWFDSGCMPFAQWGWPHQGDAEFKGAFPADFISEAIDQTRGWFYSLLMVSTLLFDEAQSPHPYKTCIVLGHVCDKTGKKESKSKGNYTPPDEILETDGADAMRWYFYAANPPWSNTRYSADAVRQAQQEFLVKLRNVYAFFVIYAEIDGFDPATSPKRPAAERALLDRWILSELQLTLRDVTTAMDEFRLYDAAQRIVRLADAVSNWYVRRSRDRFWAQVDAAEPGAPNDKWDAFHTLWEVLTTIAQISAPFVPFITEEIYRNLVLSPYPERPASVHLTDWPEGDAAQIDERLSEEMQAVRDVVSLGLQIRASHKLKVRQPLPAAEIVLGHPELTERLRPYADLIADELNVKEVVFTQHAEDRVSFAVKPNYRELGPIFGKRMPEVRAALDGADGDTVRRALATHGQYEVKLPGGEAVALTTAQIQVGVEAHEGFAAAGGTVGVVVLTATLTDALVQEGVAREITSRIQAIRKERDLEYTARIAVYLEGGDTLMAAAREHSAAIAAETLCDGLHIGDPLPSGGAIAESDVDGEPLKIHLSVV